MIFSRFAILTIYFMTTNVLYSGELYDDTLFNLQKFVIHCDQYILDSQLISQKKNNDPSIRNLSRDQHKNYIACSRYTYMLHKISRDILKKSPDAIRSDVPDIFLNIIDIINKNEKGPLLAIKNFIKKTIIDDDKIRKDEILYFKMISFIKMVPELNKILQSTLPPTIQNCAKTNTPLSEVLKRFNLQFLNKTSKDPTDNIKDAEIARGGANSVYLATNTKGGDTPYRVVRVPLREGKESINEIKKDLLMQKTSISSPELGNYFLIPETLINSGGITIGEHNIDNQKSVVSVYPFMYGGELKRNLETITSKGEPATVQFALQLAKGVNLLHQQNLAHRDIKSENIMFADKERTHLKFIDFGEMQTAKDQGEDLPIRGTGKFNPPEAFDPKTINSTDTFTIEQGQKYDIYSLGIVLYEMKYGKIPEQLDSSDFSYECVENFANYYKNLPENKQISNLAQISSYDNVVMWAMNPDANKRPTSSQLLEALQKISTP